MPSNLHTLTHGTPSLKLFYMIVWIGMLVGLVQGRASLGKLLLSPLSSVLVALFAALISGIASAILEFMGAWDWLQAAFSVVIDMLIAYVAGRALAMPTLLADSTHRRGAIVSDLLPDSPPQSSGVTLAGRPVALSDETKHFKLVGTTGTGKSTAIREILSAALSRGDRVIIADPDGGYLARFHDASRGDVILNPFDGDALKWDLFGEIINDYDVEQLARSLIPDSGEDRTWGEYARTFFSAVVQQAIVAKVANDAELYRLITSAPSEELRVLLAGTPAGPFLEPGNEKMFGSVRSIASSALGALKYTTRQQAAPFSVRRWVKQRVSSDTGARGGVLFFPYHAGEIAALRSVISAWMRIAIFTAMDRAEGDQRLWFIVDELDALGEIDGLKDALARLRKFGGRCVLGFQSIAQVSETYGRGVADTIVENCGNTLILRCSASERGGTSEFASKLIGQREVMHTTRSRSRRPSEWFASTTTSENLKIEPAVMASEIERLPDLEGFLKLASIPDWQRVKLTPLSEPTPVRPRKPTIIATAPTAPSASEPASTQVAPPQRTPRAKPAPRTVQSPRRKTKSVQNTPKSGSSDVRPPAEG